MTNENWLERWNEVVAKGDSGAIEEFWLARLEEGVSDPGVFNEALKQIRSAGKRTLAATLLELVAEQARTEGSWDARKSFVSELLRMGIGDSEAHKKSIEESIRHIWAGRPSLEKLLKHFALRQAKKPLDVLLELETWLAHDVGGVFAMAGRGAGRVTEANPHLGLVRLDFEKEKKIPMPIGAATRYLTPLPSSHFLRRRLEEKNALMAEVKADPSAALEAVLTSFATPMTMPEIKSAMEGLISDGDWQAWWTRAKKHPRVLASGSGTKVLYRLGGEGGVEDEIRAEFAAAGPAERIDLARRHGSRNKVLAAFMIDELLALANQEGLAPGIVWEAIYQAARLGGGDNEISTARRRLFALLKPLAVLEDINDSNLRETVLTFLSSESVELYRETAQVWIEKETHPRLLSQIAAKLCQINEPAKVTAFLDQVFLHPNRYPAALTWASEIDENDTIFALVDERRSGAFLIRIVELGERKEFSLYRNRLREVISPRGLAGRIVNEKLTIDQAKRLLQLAELPGEFATERTWLRRVAIGRYPELRQAAPSQVIPALASTAARMQDELKKLLEKEIPEVLKAIQIAKEHGDLSENFEYHAARARQEYISARASKLQEDLANVRIIDPATVDLSVVRVGARVTLSSEIGSDTRFVTILGPYEGNPEAGIVSNGSEIAQLMLERPTGASISFDNRRWVITAIEPHIP